MTIIRTRAEVPAASTADLLESYNAYTGKSIKKFSSREAAETQTSNAIMSAENEAGKLGVRKGQKPVAMTVVELEAARNAKARDLAGAPADKKAQGTPKSAIAATAEVLAGKSLRGALSAKVVGEPNKPKAKAERPLKKPGAGRAPKVEFVLPTGAGRSKMQEGSQRRGVFDAIVGKCKGKGGKPVNVDELQDDFQETIRGHVLKLIFEGHLSAVDKDGKAVSA